MGCERLAGMFGLEAIGVVGRCSVVCGEAVRSGSRRAGLSGNGARWIGERGLCVIACLHFFLWLFLAADLRCEVFLGLVESWGLVCDYLSCVRPAVICLRPHRGSPG